jgi:RimJ/RimL family protein N-acetyltransferase
MVYEKVLEGKFVNLKSITLDDVEFSYNIRNDEKNRDTVGQLAASLESQRKYIEWQRQEPYDYYFVIWNKRGERVGLIGVYDIHGDVGEVGRFVCNGTSIEAMEAEVVLEKFYREVLGLKKTVAVIYTSNKKHLSNQKKRGSVIKDIVMRNGVECAYFETIVSEKSLAKVRKLLDMIGENSNE